MKKTCAVALTMILLLSVAMSAFALPNPKSAHYPRGGNVTLSPLNESTNTYAFKADGKTHNKVCLHLANAYADHCGTEVTIQVFVVNKWGNWIAFGDPQSVALGCTPASYDVMFPIREGKPFCFVMSSYGAPDKVFLPYIVDTSA